MLYCMIGNHVRKYTLYVSFNARSHYYTDMTFRLPPTRSSTNVTRLLFLDVKALHPFQPFHEVRLVLVPVKIWIILDYLTGNRCRPGKKTS